jgi:hypothetical protein
MRTGVPTTTSLLYHETEIHKPSFRERPYLQSFRCAEVEVRLSGVVRGALEHFLLLPSHAHRDAWTNLLLLTITKLLKLPEPRVRKWTKIGLKSFKIS